MDPLYENLAHLVGRALAERWMKVLARRRAEKAQNAVTAPTKRTQRKDNPHKQSEIKGDQSASE